MSVYESGGIIFARNDRMDILTLADLRDKRVIGGTPKSLNAFQAQAAEMLREGYSLMEHAGQVIFSSSTMSILNAVLDGTADVGFLEAGVVEEMVALGELRRKDIRILHVVEAEEYPFTISTHLYPGMPMTMHSNVPFLIQRLVSEALLSLEANSTAARQGSYTGWRPAANYFELIDVLEASGVLPEGGHVCVDTSDVYNIVTCPDQYIPRSRAGIEEECRAYGFTCPESDNITTYQCLCHPCTAACGENEEQQPDGVCLCLDGYIAIQDKCVEMTSLVVGIAIPVVVLLALLGWFAARWQIRKADSLWHVRPHELKFDDPAKVLGAGSFGVVIKAEYRGSAVALKSLRPPPRTVTSSTVTSSQGGLRSVVNRLRGGFSHSDSSSRKKTARFGFAYSGFEHVEDKIRRGKLQLMRALRQGVDEFQDKQPAIDGDDGHTKTDHVSTAASGRPNQSHAMATSKRSPRNFWKTRAGRERCAPRPRSVMSLAR
jgi:hypothetical protein